MSRPLLHIQNLSVDFVSGNTATKALKNINISVSRGELLAVVGESGSGKSVTALSVLQLLPSPPAAYRSGQILLQTGEVPADMLKADQESLSTIRGNRVAMIFQEPMTSLNPVMTCGAQVREAILQHQSIPPKEAEKKVIELFTRVKLPEPAAVYKRYPHQLSGGQKQRVMIAMAMSCEPDLLICDEPTTALDVTVQKNILELIRELQLQNRMGVIFITHDLGVVAEIADRVAVMYKGSIVEEAPTAQLFHAPQHPYTRALLACRPALHPKGERLPVVSDFMEVTETGEIIAKKPLPHTDQGEKNTAISAKEVLLSVRDLSVYFPARKNFLGKTTAFTKAVDGISFDLYKGETLGLVGESGCGKSSLGRALLRLINTADGEISYRGIDLLNADGTTLMELRREMQLIFQDPYSSLNPRLTIGKAIAEPLKVHGIIKDPEARYKKVLELLEKVGLKPEHFHRYPHEFSGGQRQRIVIARALALQPSFIICDESVSALDVSVQAQVLNLLNDLKKEFGFTAIFISHDLSVVRYISDRIMVMNKGKMEEMGPAEEVYHHPRSTYTQKLISSIPRASL